MPRHPTRLARLQWGAAAVSILLVAGCGRNPATGTATPPLAAPAAMANAVFRDVAKESGIDFGWGHGGRSPLDIQETIGHGCSFLDYDQDGLMDIILVGNRTCALYHNLGGGRFEDVTAESGLKIDGALCGVAVGDYDNDGYPDVYITGYGKSALYHNRGKGLGARRETAPTPNTQHPTPIFEDVTAKAGVGSLGPYDFVTAAAFVDLDGDGRLDLIAGRYIKFTPASMRICKYGGVETNCGVLSYEPDMSHVYRNNIDGTFTDVTKSWGFDGLHGRCLGLGICASDTGKGVMVYSANDEQPCDLMVRNGLKYENIGVTSTTAYGRDGMRQAAMGVDWGDFNNDGRPDLVVGTFQGEPKSLYRSDSPGQFTEVSGQLGLSFATFPYITWTAKFLDYDNDGWLDLFITNGHVQDNANKVDHTRSYPQPLQLFHNEQGRQFHLTGPEAGPAFGAPIVGRGASVGDFDNDGRPDLLIVSEEGRALLLHNERVNGNHWIGIRLIGTSCNRDAIGARVLVAAAGKTTVRDQQLCGGYISGQDPRLLFGLGARATVDRIEIRWPNGHRDTIQGGDARLKIDRYITIRESGHEPRGRL